MDLSDLAKQNATGDTNEARLLFETPTRSTSCQARKVYAPAAWKDVLEKSRECKNLILLSEPGQRVVRAIREICEARQPMNNQCKVQKQGMSSDNVAQFTIQLQLIGRYVRTSVKTEVWFLLLTVYGSN